MSFMKVKKNLQGTRRGLGDVLPTLESLPQQIEKEDRRVLVTSGSGVLGYRVAMSLLEAGHPLVRVGIYNKAEDRADECCGPQCVEALQAKGAEVVNFDWTNQDDFDAALKDVQIVFCTIPHVEWWQDVFPKFARKCMYKNVQHFIKVSFLRPVGGRHNNGASSPCKAPSSGFDVIALKYRENVPFCRFHGTCDDYLITMARQATEDHQMSYTILACSHLMTTPLFWQGNLLRADNLFVTASYGMGVNYVSPNDVADAAVVVILRPEQHVDKIYNLTGPGPTTDARVAELLSAHLLRPIQHKPLGYHEYVAFFTKERGVPSLWQVKDSAAMERMKARGIDESSTSYTKDLQTLTGKAPESFAAFLNNQESHMRPGKSFL